MPKNFNAVKTDKGLEVYLNEMNYYADEYINTLLDPKDIYDNRVFTGLITYLSNKLMFRNDLQTYESIDFLWNIWKQYRDLVYKFKQNPTIEEFTLLVGINTDTLYQWANEERRKDDICNELSCTRADAIRKMQNECKLGRYKGAERGNVGMIFLCKAVDHLVETAPAPIAEIDKRERLSLESSRQEFETFQIEKKD